MLNIYTHSYMINENKQLITNFLKSSGLYESLEKSLMGINMFIPGISWERLRETVRLMLIYHKD